MPKLIRILAVSFLLILVSACSQGQENDTSITAGGQPTAVVVRILDLDVYPATASADPTPTIPFPTITDTPTTPANLTPSSAPIIQTPLSGQPACTNKAEFIRHLSISDNTALESGQSFNKVWEVKNIGTCTWNEEYALVFLSGEQMNSPEKIPLSKNVSPGETIDLQITLKAPMVDAAYTGKWMLSDPQGVVFGIGSDGQQPLEVIIDVKPTPRPTPG